MFALRGISGGDGGAGQIPPGLSSPREAWPGDSEAAPVLVGADGATAAVMYVVRVYDEQGIVLAESEPAASEDLLRGALEAALREFAHRCSSGPECAHDLTSVEIVRVIQ